MIEIERIHENRGDQKALSEVILVKMQDYSLSRSFAFHCARHTVIRIHAGRLTNPWFRSPWDLKTGIPF